MKSIFFLQVHTISAARKQIVIIFTIIQLLSIIFKRYGLSNVVCEYNGNAMQLIIIFEFHKRVRFDGAICSLSL